MDKNLRLLLLILIIASFFRLYQITTIPPGLYPDEAMNGNNALQALSTGDFKTFYPENNGREGLFINIQALFLKALNSPSQVSAGEIWEGKPWVLRLPSAIFGILTVLGVYFLAKELFSTRVGLFSAFFLAANFWHINFSRIGFRAIIAPLLLVWAVYFFLLALRKLKEQNAGQLPGSKILCGLGFNTFVLALFGGIVYGLGFYSYIAYRITPLLFLLFIPFFGKEKGFWKAAGVFLLVAFFAALPLGIYFLQHPADFMGRTTQVSVFSSPSPLADLATNIVKTLGMFIFAGDWNWRHNLSGAPELFWPVGIVFLIGIVIGLKKLREFGVWNLELGILFSWFILAMFPVVISNEGIPHALRSILMIPPAIILAGVGGAAVYEWLKIRNEYVTRAVVAFFAAFIVSGTYYSYFVSWAKSPDVQGAFAADYLKLGREINALPASTSKYVVVQAGGVAVNGIPMPAQTVMFVTDTFTTEKQQAKNIHYTLPGEEKNIPAGADIFYIR
ncbi:MAG: glycosyltransferase family 39 protein [Candidatus Liptonbacteria bacterium]|nr:glycosyltransferase family 39 protein [Candidatus Liptonbacteria bacterium]